MHVLHLIDLRERSEEAARACRAAASLAGVRHRIIGLGSAADAAWAARTGLRLDGLSGALAAPAELSARRVRRLIGDREGRGATRPWADVVQCWSCAALGLARLASGQRTPPRVGALLHPPAETTISLQRRRLEQAAHYATLFTFDRFIRSAWGEIASARRGGRLLEQNIRVFDPAEFDTSGPRPAERDRLRSRLGLREDDVAIVLLADPPSAADLQRFMFVLGLMFTTGARVVGLAPRGCGGERRAARFVRLHGRRWGLIHAELPLEALLPACDAAVWDAIGSGERAGGSAGALSIVSALRRGVPVVAGRHPISIEAMGASHPDLIARDATLSALADRLFALGGRPRGAGGRSIPEAPHSRHGPTSLLALWQEVTNTPVRREGLPTPMALVETAA